MLIVKVDSSGVLQFFNLFLDFGCDSRMAMAHTRGGDSCKQIKISLSILVKKVLHFSIDYHDWFFVEHPSCWAQMLLSHVHAFFI
jgi:hypothetical protein